MNPDFILWYDNVSTFQLIITIIGSVIVSVPMIFLIIGFIAGMLFHTDSNDLTNNDSDGCL